MPKTKIEYEAIYEAAKIIAGNRGGKCNGNKCENCDHDCMYLEFAHLAHALGYRRTESRVKNNIMKSVPFLGMVEALAKALAANRGYGCNDYDCCFKCICCGDCIPRDIAKHLIQNGYRKEDL